MPLALSPKQARKFGLIEKEKRTPTERRPSSLNSYSGCGAALWFFTTIGAQGQFVYAWKVAGTSVLRTAVFPAGDGDDLGRHYRPAIEAIVRGEWTVSDPSVV